jgi:phage gpG-like protein
VDAVIEATQTERGYALTLSSMQTLERRMLDAAGTGLARGLLLTVAMVQREYLQGPRPEKLGVVTSRLLQSISSKVTVTDKTVTGRIGSNVRYAAFHEFGFHGTQSVSEHTRVVNRVRGPGKGQYGPLVVGQRFVKGGGSGGKAAARKQRSGFVTFETIRAHQRKVDYAGRPFVHPALVRMLPVILQEIQKEVAGLTPTPHGQ